MTDGTNQTKETLAAICGEGFVVLTGLRIPEGKGQDDPEHRGDDAD